MVQNLKALLDVLVLPTQSVHCTDNVQVPQTIGRVQNIRMKVQIGPVNIQFANPLIQLLRCHADLTRLDDLLGNMLHDGDGLAHLVLVTVQLDRLRNCI